MTEIATKTATQEALEAIATQAPPPQLPAIRQERPPQQKKTVATVAASYPAKIAKSIIGITKEIGRIQKEGFNEFQRYKYTRWEDINEKLSPLLSEHGLIIVQSEQSRNLLEENDKGSVLAIVYHFTIINEHGDQWPPVEWTAIARLRDQKGVTDDKAAAKCHTQAEKQFCIKQFKIRTDDFIDSDAHSTLPKKNARDVYQKLQAEIDGATQTSALKEWAKNNAERIKVLPNDWQNILRDRYSEKLGDLENQFNAQLAAETNEEIYDDKTGEIETPQSTAAPAAPAPPSPQPQAGAADLSKEIAEHDKALAQAAENGTKALMAAWKLVPFKIQPTLKAALDRRHKPIAQEADAQ